MQLLASVVSAGEARIALAAGADVIDAKDPARGPLGALDHAGVAAIVAAVAGHARVSATLGHDRVDAPALLREGEALAQAGVSYLKVGIAACSINDARVANTLARLAGLHALVVVPLVDRALAGDDADLALLDAIAALGARGVLFDTHDKRDSAGRRRTLRQCVPDVRLGALVGHSRRRGLLCGLAGGLGCEDVAPLAALAPDLLGFRGALCVEEDRGAALVGEAVRKVRERMDRFKTVTRSAIAGRQPPLAVSVPAAGAALRLADEAN